MGPAIDTRDKKLMIAFWPDRPYHGFALWFGLVASIMLVLYGIVVPLTAHLVIMQSFADAMAWCIPQLEEAAAITDFEAEARLMLAIDRALVPLMLLLGIALNTGGKTWVHIHPGVKLALVAVVFVPFILYVYFYPHVPEPPSPNRFDRRNLYPIMTSNLGGFALVHGAFSLVSAALLVMIALTASQYRALRDAYQRWHQRIA